MSSPLTHFEMEMLISVCEYYWTPEMREKIATLLPTVYAKLTGTTVAIVAKGKETSMSIEAAAPKKPIPNPNKGAPWE